MAKLSIRENELASGSAIRHHGYSNLCVISAAVLGCMKASYAAQEAQNRGQIHGYAYPHQMMPKGNVEYICLIMPLTRRGTSGLAPTMKVQRSSRGGADLKAFRKWLTQNGLTAASANNYKTWVNNLQGAGLALEPELFQGEDEYREWAIEFVEDKKFRITGGYAGRRNHISALKRYIDFLDKTQSPRPRRPKLSIAAWLDYNKSLNQLRQTAGISRNILGEVAELLIAASLNLSRRPQNQSGHDLVNASKGITYQVKAREVKAATSVTQLGICRSLDFDVLTTVFFSRDGKVLSVLEHQRTELSAFLRKSSNGYQAGHIFSTTAAFREAGTNIAEKIWQKFPELRPNNSNFAGLR